MGQRSPLVTLAAAGVGLVAFLAVDSTQAAGGTPDAAATVSTSGASAPTSAPPEGTATPGGGSATPAGGTLTPGGGTATPAAGSATPAGGSVTPVGGSVTPTGTASSGSVAPAAKAVVYLGRTSGREATVAIAVKGQRAVAYVCDGVRLEAWLSGAVTGGQINLQSKTGERLSGTVSVRSLVGELTLRGRTLRFSASPAGPPAGLYRAKNSKSTIGWIVLPDGDQVGIDNDGTPAPAPRLDPASGGATVGGVQVTAHPVAGDESLS